MDEVVLGAFEGTNSADNLILDFGLQNYEKIKLCVCVPPGFDNFL